MSNTPQNCIVWFEIPVTDLGKGIAFYEAVTGGPLAREQMGPDEVAIFKSPGVAGHLCVGEAGQAGKGPTLHLACAGTAEDASARVIAAGGQVVSPVMAIPQGRFAYALDPYGNSIGLFEAA